LRSARPGVVLLALLGACGSTEEIVDLGVVPELDLSVMEDLVTPIDLAIPADLLPPRTARLNVIANTGSPASVSFLAYGPGCSRSFVGACEIVECPAGTQRGWTPSDTQAGAARITVGDGVGAVVLDPLADGSYPSKTAPGFTPATGGSFHVEAAGAEIPAFAADLVVPVEVAGNGGLPFSSSTLSRSADAVGSFAPTAGVDVLLSIGGGEASVICVGSAASGSIAVPAALMARLPAGVASWSLASVTRTELVTGSWSIQIRAAHALADGSQTGGNITLQ
jgi:hypothetical protein